MPTATARQAICHMAARIAEHRCLPRLAAAADRTSSRPSWTTAVWRASMPAVACFFACAGQRSLLAVPPSFPEAKAAGDSWAPKVIRGHNKRLRAVRDEAASFAWMEASKMSKLHPRMRSRKIQRWQFCLSTHVCNPEGNKLSSCMPQHEQRIYDAGVIIWSMARSKLTFTATSNRNKLGR
jgi:hypothetical protein